jgi:lipopolysaccharide O-acetyltransferase
MIGRYGMDGIIKLIISFIYTKLFFSNVRLVRLPIDVRNKKLISFGNGLTTGVGCRIEAYSIDKKKVLRIGNNVEINDYVHITAMDNVSIGDKIKKPKLMS